MVRNPRDEYLDVWFSTILGLWGSLIHSQNHKMAEVGRDLWRSLCPSQLPRTASRWPLNISEDGDSTTSLGNLCQCLITLTGKKCFLMFRGNLLCFCLCPLLLVMSLGTTGRSLALSAMYPPFRYICWDPPWAFSSPCWTIPALSTFPHGRDAPDPASS